MELKIASVVNYAPGYSGMYGTVRDLVLAERKLGHKAEIIDDARELKKDYGIDGITPVPMSFGDEADIICWHHSMLEEWFNEPHRNLVMFLHGTPEFNLHTELRTNDRVLSLIIGSAVMKLPKAFISMWKRHIPFWENMLRTKVHYVPAWTTLDEWRISKRETQKDVIRIAMMDYWRDTREPFGIIHAIECLRKNTNKKIEVDVWGITGVPNKTWQAVIQWLVEDGVMVLKGNTRKVQEEIFDQADMVVTMSTEETRVVREAYAAGTPVVCGLGPLHFTKYAENGINPERLAAAIDKCHEDLLADQAAMRKDLRAYAEKNFDANVAAAKVIKVFENIVKENGSVNHPKLRTKNRICASIDHTCKEITDRFDKKLPVCYTRYGDGELLFMSDTIQEGGAHKNSPELKNELIKAFKYKDNKTQGYIVGIAAGIVNEGRMRKGLFGSFDDDEMLIEVVKKHRPREMLENYIALAYKSVFEPSWFIDFLRKYVHNKKVLFVGGVHLQHNVLLKRAFAITTFYPLPSGDAYYHLTPERMAEIEKLARDHELVLCSAGMAAKCLAFRLWTHGCKTDFLDLGSISDGIAGVDTRTWIKMSGVDYRLHYENAFMPRKTDIIVLTHKNEEKTIRCFEALAKHTDNYKVIWVDNGSGQESIDKCMEAAKKLKECDILKSPTNLGFSKGVNLGLRKALVERDCDYVVLLNNDVIVTPGWLQSLVSALVAGEMDAIGPLTSENNPHSLDALRPIMPDLPVFAAESHDERAAILGSKFGNKTFQAGNMISFFCCCLKRETVEQTGLLDENIFAYGEDNDYAYRMHQVGKKMGIAVGAYVHHDHGATTAIMGEGWGDQKRKEAKIYLQKKWGRIMAENEAKDKALAAQKEVK